MIGGNLQLALARLIGVRPKCANLITSMKTELTIQRSSHAIEWRKKLVQADRKERMAFFYCSKSESQGTPPLEAPGSFVAQLALSPDSLLVDGSAKGPVEGPMSGELSLEQCSKRLVALVAPHRRVTLVADALDDCESYKELLCRLIAVAGNWLIPGAPEATTHTKALCASVSPPRNHLENMWRLTVLYIHERPQTPL
jgi:hypothetical protein